MTSLSQKRHRITTSNSQLLQQRLEAVRESMSRLRLQALLITELSHIRYLTGFSGSNGLCLIIPQKQFFITDRRYESQALQEVDDFITIIAKESLFRTLGAKRLIPHRVRIGFESQHISIAEMLCLKKLISGRQFVPTALIIENLAAVKNEREIDLIRTAIQITEKVFEKILPQVRPGVLECDISAEISYWHRKYGAEGDAFDPIVASGARSALPHARASQKIIKRGDMVVLDFGCRYYGYNSDFTRTIAVGKPSAEQKKMYQIVLEAQTEAIAAARQGQTARAIDAVARKHIQKNNYARYFIHSLGHGIGMLVHEPLRLSARSKAVLQTGNVVTVEPGIYVPAICGVRIEDIIVIRDHGCDVLTTVPQQLIIV